MKSALSSEKDASIRDAHARGLTIVDTIKMIRERYQMSLGEAKNLVSNHSIWQDVVRASDSLKDDIEKFILE
jgi:ribosomal protein L7/L12